VLVGGDWHDVISKRMPTPMIVATFRRSNDSVIDYCPRQLRDNYASESFGAGLALLRAIVPQNRIENLVADYWRESGMISESMG
jgi:hypothetical protein